MTPTRVAGSRTKGLTMAFKLLPLVRAGVRFVDGKQLERQEDNDRKDAA